VRRGAPAFALQQSNDGADLPPCTYEKALQHVEAWSGAKRATGREEATENAWMGPSHPAHGTTRGHSE